MAPRPIGYWVKLLDRLIDESFSDALGDGVTRRHWQALNVLRAGPTDQAGVDGALAPFLDGPGASTASVVGDLRARGWVTDGFTLTDAGRTAMDELGTKVTANRARVTVGISQEQYAATLETLAQMCRNLQDPDNEPLPEEPRRHALNDALSGPRPAQ